MDKVRFTDRERVNLTDLLAFFGLSEDFWEFFLTTVVGDGLVIYDGLTVEATATPSGQVEITVGTGFFNGTPLRIEAIQTGNILDGSPSEPPNRSTAGTWETGLAADGSNPRNDIVMIKWEDNGEEPFVRFFIDDTVSPPTEAPSTINSRLNDFFDIIVVRGTPAASPVDPDTTTQEAAGYTKLARITVGTGVTTITNPDIDDSTSATPFPPGVSAGVPPIEDIFPISDEDVVTDFDVGSPSTNYMNDPPTDNVQEALIALDTQIKTNEDDIAAVGAHTPPDEDVVTSFAGKKFVTGLTDQEQVNLELDLVLGSLAHQSFIEGCEVRFATVATVTIQPGTIAVPDGTAVEVRNRTTAITVDITDTTNVYDGLYNNGGGTEGAEASATWYYAYAVVNTADAQGSTFGQGISKFAPGTDMLHPDPDAVLGTRIWRFVGTVRNDGSSNFIEFFRDGETVSYEDQITTLSTGFGGGAAPTSFTSASMASAVPTTSTAALITAEMADTTGVSGNENTLFIADGDKTGSTGGHVRCRTTPSGAQRENSANSFLQRLNGSQALVYRFVATTDVDELNIHVNGYYEPRENLVV